MIAVTTGRVYMTVSKYAIAHTLINKTLSVRKSDSFSVSIRMLATDEQTLRNLFEAFLVQLLLWLDKAKGRRGGIFLSHPGKILDYRHLLAG